MENKRDIVIWGASGHAKVIRDAIGQDRILALFDSKNVTPPWAVNIYFGTQGFDRWRENNFGEFGFFIAIGGNGGADRIQLAKFLNSRGLVEESIVHSSAVVEKSAQLGKGNHILAGAVLGAAAKTGNQTILNTKSSVDHDSTLGCGVHVSPGATICGEVSVGDRVFIGAGAVVLPKLSIGDDVIIGAGSIVTKSIPNGWKVIGTPARKY